MSKSNNKSFSEKVKRSIRESALWMLGALAFILWLALITYHADDPGIAQINNSTEINNAIGQLGAFVSDLLFNLFGISAYLFVGMIFYYGWLLYVDLKNTDTTARADLFLRISGFLLLLISSSALATLHFSAEGFNQTAGGVLGQVVGEYLESMMKLLGASTLLFFIWLTSVSLFLSISWLKIMDEIGRITLFGWNEIVIKIDTLKDQMEGRRIQAERQIIIKAEKKRIAKRTPPKIEPVISPLETSGRAEKERQVALFEPSNEGELPSLSLLDDPPPQKKGFSGER